MRAAASADSGGRRLIICEHGSQRTTDRSSNVAQDSTADGVYLGLMSGTSMDGVDGVAVEFAKGKPPVVLAEAFVGFAEGLREALFGLQQPGENEIEREALAANALATRYT